ncbi:MAG: hypothetical protein ACEY3J_01185 [Arsenophonus sp.]
MNLFFIIKIEAWLPQGDHTGQIPLSGSSFSEQMGGSLNTN